MTTSHHLVFDLKTGPTVLGEVHRALDRTWAQHCHVPDSIRLSMATAAAEIGANIVRHAGEGPGGGPLPIRMDIEVLPHRVTVVFTDEGVPATVDLDGITMPDETAKAGRGLALASAVLDGLSYERGDGCNHWTLVSRPFG